MYERRWPRLIGLCVLALPILVLAANSEVEELFQNAAKSVAAQSSVPVYIPTSLQSLDRYVKSGCVFWQAAPTSFDIAIYGRVTEYGKSEPLPCQPNNAAFLAEIHGDNKPMPDLWKEHRAHKVLLASGRAAWFIPVSCGGSCGPATLYWQTPKGSYWLQLKLASDSLESRQLKELLAIANSMVPVTTER